jgi:spoIIIJ-associated protein
MSQRFEGRNLEEALQNAAQALGVERWQLTYHVLMEKRGFLGGVKRVVLEADVNVDAAPPAVAAPVPPGEPRPPRADHGPRRGGRSGGGGGGRRDGGRSREGGRRGRGRDHDREFRSGDFETFLLDVPEQGPESEAAKLAREWIENVIALSRFDLVVRTEEKEEQIIVRLYGSDAARLTDRHGELLDAIQVLANKAMVGRKVEKDIELDSEEFKDRRVEDLGRRAREVADRVRRGGREELLPAMTPIERRIVHIALRDDADVTTESRGEGFYKRVAIIPRPEGQETSDAPAAPES